MLNKEKIGKLRSDLRGSLIQSADDAYDEARQVWNAMIDRRPEIIVQPLGAADVMAAVTFARDQELEIAIKGGGHNVAGNAVCDHGLMLDLSRMKSIRIDLDKQTAHVEPGALLHDFDLEAQAHGLVTPAGFVSTTGVAGLTLGGGFGYLSRKFGLTVDNLRSIDLVTADGNLVRASADENPGLFWALRGGGGNFGVVTSFEFGLHKLGPKVLAGPVAWQFQNAPTVLREVTSFLRNAPDEVSCLPIIRYAPPAPFLPEKVHGEMVLIVAMIYAGDPEDGKKALAPLRGISEPIADAVSEMPYVKFQSLFDAASGPGARNYWKSHYLADFNEDAIDLLCDHAARMSSPESAIGMLSLGGAISRKVQETTPYPHREAAWVVNIQSRWREAKDDETHIRWARELFDAMTPLSTGGFYINFISGDEGEEHLRAAYGDEIYERLTKVKTEWDPNNIFHLNHNIEPKS